MSEPAIKTSQRVSRSCIECGRRKIKCDKKSPCQPCIRRNAAHECKRPIARVRGQLTVYTAEDAGSPADIQLQDLLRERNALQAQIAELETALALSKPCGHSRTSESTDYTQPAATLEDLVPAFEQFDLGIRVGAAARAGAEKAILNGLYEPAADPLFLLLPSRDASLGIVTFSLQTLGWIHCAVNANDFLAEHHDFWKNVELGTGIKPEQRPWVALYFAVLAVGILYSDPEDVPSAAHLPRLGMPRADPISVAVDTSHLWYEAALKELPGHSFSGTPSLCTAQALVVLSLCHSNFGEHQREWLISSFATSMARLFDMHKLGNEANCSKDVCRRPEWSSPVQRELGRRLWWTCVIRDWLGSWVRPPSISPASFCCQPSTTSSHGEYFMPSFYTIGSPGSSESTNLEPPSPAHYHSILCRLSYIVYIYIKANTHQTHLKFVKAIEEITAVRRDLPLHLSPGFPANEDDVIWESEYPWISFQRYLIAYVLDFLLLSIARVLNPQESRDDSMNYRQLALESANRILDHYAKPVPRVYRLVWVVSAATVAASVYISLDMLANSHDYRGDSRNHIIGLLRQASVELKKHAVVAVHAAKGSAMLEDLLPLLEQHDFDRPRTSYSMKDLLQQLAVADLGVPSNPPVNSGPVIDGLPHVSNGETVGIFDGNGNTIDGNFAITEWEHVFSQL
ncbi:hypothetical protein J3E72DRAFT_232471 [Bipolaris maydis]|nr:hypothetical protein J3E73DRAFT_429941 [Bipolaris maydis]KAJ5061850.1 hypothetical protein J3E74DRAFT_464493 [Bipolaris maydis]KAJ6203457.1 hypothetical protein J3E72DRAFT_232471 [Bipolaris maydis]KAJ6214822.1 hypothetical protein PSV09DRAFT_2406597 [Bipolaris maydis]KAJ6287115.1 hypothetical protein J3E71DRAFT_208334 [Bipolaris maydis]